MSIIRKTVSTTAAVFCPGGSAILSFLVRKTVGKKVTYEVYAGGKDDEFLMEFDSKFEAEAYRGGFNRGLLHRQLNQLESQEASNG